MIFSRRPTIPSMVWRQVSGQMISPKPIDWLPSYAPGQYGSTVITFLMPLCPLVVINNPAGDVKWGMRCLKVILRSSRFALNYKAFPPVFYEHNSETLLTHVPYYWCKIAVVYPLA